MRADGRLHGQAHRRDGGRLRRRVRQGQSRARRDVVRHAGDQAATGEHLLPRARPRPRTARRRSTSRSRAPAGSRSTASAWSLTARRSCGSGRRRSASSTPVQGPARAGPRRRPRRGLQDRALQRTRERLARGELGSLSSRGAARTCSPAPGAARPLRSGGRRHGRHRAGRARPENACSGSGSTPAPWARRRG